MRAASAKTRTSSARKCTRWRIATAVLSRLRPENTASVMRAYIEHRLDQIPGVKKFYYMGPMFRRERPQKGRFRQFYQIGAEAIGSESPVVDAEVIEMVVEILLRARDLTGFHLLINSVGCPNCRPAFIALLREKLAEIAPKMCADCQRRATTNPLRVLDCKVPEDQPHHRRHCRRSWIIWTTSAARISRPCARIWISAAIAVRGPSAPGARSGLLHAHDVRNHAWRAGRPELVLGGGRYDGLAEVDRLESSRAWNRILDRRGSPGDERRRSASGPLQDRRWTCFLRPWAKPPNSTPAALAAELRAQGVSVERSVDRN